MTETTQALKHTALHAQHEELGANFTDFGGWDMPLKYGSELAEHKAVRSTAGLFDLSHMGEVYLTGPEAGKALNTALAGNLNVMKVGKAKYSLILNAEGKIIDDLIVYRLEEEKFLVVPNAGNAPVVAAELAARAAGFDVVVDDASDRQSLIAVQGPNAEAILKNLSADEATVQAVTELKYYAAVNVVLGGINVLLARTGYTGEDGFELIIENEDAAAMWEKTVEAGKDHELVPCGLASRDSLRLEAGMPLYGNELSLERTPFDAGFGPVVSFKKEENFVGREALEALRGATPARKLVGLKGLGKRAGRGGYAIVKDGATIGEITSGQPSPTLGYPVALGYVDAEFGEVGTELEVDLRGKTLPFVVVELPFYTRAK
ncbi:MULTISPECIES: glycine cleavage system aminomethyltransferase GcvT [Glutamicibacter]|jgi:aminomethyltransferase|uniref:Aminomethyltransferase n=2 Tax=Glutamicibacter arilaitensis TaxID=256701 RepID=A0A2N7S1R3_9MICC|nr:MULTISPECIES: glycine cleavage system aminomethyltransferase GcvT [Glutamicibacter]PMQ20086.1 glycine cleavage system protein T [Glutamicibacter arilaitensis]CBT76834.1 aminomethyltransferase [Glutamicibacter arilaitensis Re117]HCH48370.1 glycine cleavage system aminomethyltransferase GcvT [Glutamicibacter sp.]HCM95826.1 glycine cleavage system aminomethyltransferase GcvT [Glutamicibacter sp.]